jgi:hypothetical protein
MAFLRRGYFDMTATTQLHEKEGGVVIPSGVRQVPSNQFPSRPDIHCAHAWLGQGIKELLLDAYFQ